MDQRCRSEAVAAGAFAPGGMRWWCRAPFLPASIRAWMSGFCLRMLSLQRSELAIEGKRTRPLAPCRVSHVIRWLWKVVQMGSIWEELRMRNGDLGSTCISKQPGPVPSSSRGYRHHLVAVAAVFDLIRS